MLSDEGNLLSAAGKLFLDLCAQGAKRTEAPKLQSGTRWEEAVTNSKNNCGRGMEEKRGAVDERQKG